MTLTLDRRKFIAETTQLSLVLRATTLGMGTIESTRAIADEVTIAPPRNATPHQIAESYWHAECERNLEKVRQHYHPDAVFAPPGQRLVGWDAIKTYYEDSFRRYPGLEVNIVHEVASGNEAALEWQAVLIDHAGIRHPLVGVNVVRVEDGKYREVHAYYDPSSLSG